MWVENKEAVGGSRGYTAVHILTQFNLYPKFIIFITIIIYLKFQVLEYFFFWHCIVSHEFQIAFHRYIAVLTLKTEFLFITIVQEIIRILKSKIRTIFNGRLYLCINWFLSFIYLFIHLFIYSYIYLLNLSSL